MRGYKKPYRVRRKKSILRNRFFWLGILVLAVIGAISYFLFFSPLFEIKNIQVSGNEKVLAEDIEMIIRKEMAAEYGENIFLYVPLKIKMTLLGSFPQIAEVSLRRSLPQTLKVEIKERKPVAIFCQEEKCYLVDNEGVIFEETLGQTDLVKISGAKELIGKEKIAQILEIQTKLKEGLGVTTTEALIASDERLDIKTSGGWKVYFNLKGDLDWQLQELGLVLEKQIPPERKRTLEYIDLRFNRVYIKYRD